MVHVDGWNGLTGSHADFAPRRLVQLELAEPPPRSAVKERISAGLTGRGFIRVLLAIPALRNAAAARVVADYVLGASMVLWHVSQPDPFS